MRVTMVWPDCDKFSKSSVCELKDLYWVECHTDDVEEKIYPYMKKSRVQEARRTIRDEIHDSEIMNQHGNRTSCMYFLISADLSIVKPMLWFYPSSHAVNGQHPLRKIEEVHLRSLEELTDLDVKYA